MSAPEDIDFTVGRERWNEYSLSDGCLLKMKFVLIKVILTTDAQGNPSYAFNSQNLLAVYAPNKDKGTPSKQRYSPKELAESVIDDVEFKTVKEDWNIYHLKDGTKLEIKLILTRAAKTDKFDPSGSPIYLTNSQTVPKFKLSKTLKKKMVGAQKRRQREQTTTTTYRV